VNIVKGLTRTALAMVTAGVMASALTAPAHAITPDQIKARGKLIVGVLTDFPPYAGTDQNQNPAGYDVDVSKLMAKELGVKLELVAVTGPNRIPYLLTNRVDMLVATLGVTRQRAEQVSFSNPYSTLDIMVMAPKKLDIKGPKDLIHYTVGVTRAGSQDTLVTEVAPKGTRILRYDDDSVSIQAMISGQVQVLGGSNIHLATLIKRRPDLNIEEKFPLRAQVNSVGIRKEDTALLEWTNAFVAKILADGSLSKIHQKWFGTPITTMPPMPKF
jgi:polar amino acid transport system substrate-binding protein